MLCRDLKEHFKRVGTWIDWERTCDGFKAGDPEREVSTVAVAWKASWEALKTAHSRGAELLVSHESISVKAHMESGPESRLALPSEGPKFEWLEDAGLVVYRCHDFWDPYPEEGIRWAWWRGLALGGEIVADEYPFLVTQIEPRTLGELASHVLTKVSPLGQNGALLLGDPDRRVSRVATGTGASTDPVGMRELGADTGIITDDYFTHVRMGVHAREIGLSGVIVNHGVSEEWGVEALARYLGREFPDLEVFHVPQRCPYVVVTLSA